MSTYYRDLKFPFSSVRVEGSHHKRLLVWVCGQKSGELVFGPEQDHELREVLESFCREDVAMIAAKKEGASITHIAKSRTNCVISDSGEILSLLKLILNYPYFDNEGHNPMPKVDTDWFKPQEVRQ